MTVHERSAPAPFRPSNRRATDVCGPNAKPARRSAPVMLLAAQAELLDQGRIAGLVLALEIVKQTAALRNHGEQATSGVVILLVVLEVLGQVLDAFGKQCNLHLRRTGIALYSGKLGQDGLLAFS